MRLSKYRPNRESRLELSTTSMIDVVFLLLIFFLVTTTFLTPERQLKPNIPMVKETAASSDDDIEPAHVDIVRQNGIPVWQIGATVTTDLKIIRQILDQYPDKSGGAFVRLSDNCPFGMAAAAINACKQAGFTNVSFVPRQ